MSFILWCIVIIASWVGILILFDSLVYPKCFGDYSWDRRLPQFQRMERRQQVVVVLSRTAMIFVVLAAVFTPLVYEYPRHWQGSSVATFEEDGTIIRHPYGRLEWFLGDGTPVYSIDNFVAGERSIWFPTRNPSGGFLDGFLQVRVVVHDLEAYYADPDRRDGSSFLRNALDQELRAFYLEQFRQEEDLSNETFQREVCGRLTAHINNVLKPHGAEAKECHAGIRGIRS